VAQARVPRIPPDQIRRLIGKPVTVAYHESGNIADLYEIQDGLDRWALKVVRPDQRRARTEQELRALQRVVHPSIVRYRTHGEFDYQNETYPWIAMDWVDGTPLADRLPEINGWDLTRRLTLVVALLEAVEALDAVRVVHRDIKPPNILMAGDQPVIVDLGWARMTDETGITFPGQPTGSLAYNSPEQHAGESVDGRSDLFAVGLLAYEVILGLHPYWSGQDQDDVDWAAVRAQRPRVGLLRDPAMTAEIADAIDALLSFDKSARPRTGAIATVNLKAALAGVGPTFEVFKRATFLPTLGHFKEHLTSGFFDRVAAEGMVLELRANGTNQAAAYLATAPGPHRLVDPCSTFSTWARRSTPQRYASHVLPENVDPAALEDPDALVAFAQPFVDLERALGATALIAPYLHAGSNEFDRIERSMEAAEITIGSAGGLPVLAGVAIDSTYLEIAELRSRLLGTLTGTRVPGFFILVEDGRADFHQLDDEQLLGGLKELTESLARNQQVAFFGRVGSVGLPLLVAGAAGFSTGVETKNMHYIVETPDQEGGGGPATIERYYERSLFGFLRREESRSARTRNDPKEGRPPLSSLCGCPFCTAHAAILNAAAAWDDDLARRHLLWSLHTDTQELRTLRVPARREWLRERITRALSERAGIQETQIALVTESRSPTLQVWERVFCS
jgi:serine/threonine protein kinase